MSTYTLKTDNVSTCCNLILWDFLFTLFAGYTYSMLLFPSLKDFQGFLCGLALGFLLIALMNIRLFRNIIMLLFSIFWATGGYSILDDIFNISSYSAPWRFGIGIFIFLMVLGLHLSSAEDLNLYSPSDPLFQKKSKTAPKSSFTSEDPRLSEALKQVQENIDYCKSLYSQAMELTEQARSMNNNSINEFIGKNSSKIVRLHNSITREINKYNKKQQPSMLYRVADHIESVVKELDFYICTLQYIINESTSNYDNNNQYDNTYHNSTGNTNKPESEYFKGCDTLDALNKRYRDLAKVFHTDSGNGDANTFVKIKDEYELLKKLYTKK